MDISVTQISGIKKETLLTYGILFHHQRQMTVTMGNQLVECQECHNLYHQDCHKPQVTDKEVNDPRLVWYCARCTRQMKRMVREYNR